MRVIEPENELRKLFSGLVEQVFFSQVGICVPALTDYLSGVLLDFVHMDHIYRMRTVDGEVIREVSRVQAEADLGPGVDEPARVRIINKYIGDFTLFWVGLYPETLRPRRRRPVDRLREYMLEGKRGYGIASELSRAGDVPAADLLRGLSEHFESCAHGLHLVRQSWGQRVGRSHDN